MHATISADIISSTSLTPRELEALQDAIRATFSDIEAYIGERGKNSFWGRIVKGDSIECYFEDPKHALRSALLLKCASRRASQEIETSNKNGRANGLKYFEKHGLRLAIGYGGMRTIDRQRDILDGEAIYMSGRKIAEYSTSGKNRIIIKNTLFFVSRDEALNQLLNISLGFVNVLFKNATQKQIDVIYHKLLQQPDKVIENELKIKHSAINQRCQIFGWNAVADLLDLYENKLDWETATPTNLKTSPTN